MRLLPHYPAKQPGFRDLADPAGRRLWVKPYTIYATIAALIIHIGVVIVSARTAQICISPVTHRSTL